MQGQQARIKGLMELPATRADFADLAVRSIMITIQQDEIVLTPLFREPAPQGAVPLNAPGPLLLQGHGLLGPRTTWQHVLHAAI